MTTWRGAIMFLLPLLLTASGCTHQLWESAAGTEETTGITIRKVIHASKNESTNQASVCMILFDSAKQEERKVTLQIPLSAQSKWNIVEIRKINNVQIKVIEYLPATSDLKSGCREGGGHIALYQFDEKEFMEQPQERNQGQIIKLDKNVTELIYVINRNNMPLHVGYVSTSSTQGNGYAINVPVYTQFKYQITHKNAKPYLKVFTPFTVALDAAGTAAAIIILTPICFDASDGCK